MKELEAAIEIDASAERVWDVLTDFASFPDWNSFVVKASGKVSEGERVEVRIKPAGRPALTFRPTVLKAEPGRELRWLGRLGFPGLADGEHAFVIEPAGDGKVRFVQHESFSGLLVPLLTPVFIGGIEGGFQAMNAALKQRAESGVSVSA